MTSIAALSAAALLAGLSASSPGAASPPTGDVTWEAGQAVWHGETGTYDLSGGVVVRRGTVALRARTATVDPATGTVDAAGDVLLVDATRVIRAEAVHAVLDGPFEATGVLAFYKERPLEPSRVESLAEARRGRNRLTFSAERVEGEDQSHLVLERARFTLCDCGEGRAPTWEIGTRRATVVGDRATLSWPVLRVTPRFLFIERPVPVLVLPWLSLPLSERQSGLLFPTVEFRSVTGWAVALPVYLTLGRSADLTVTPEYFFGPKNPEAPGGAVKGPGARLELRWAPAEHAEGTVLFHVVEDLDRERLAFGEPGGHGLRLSVEGDHRQDLGGSTRLVSHLSLAQDPFMFRDFRGEGLPRDAYYSRSDLLVSHRAGWGVLEGGTMYLEPLVPADKQRPGPPSWFGMHLPATQRWPSVGLALLPARLGPVQIEGRAGLSRYAPLVGDLGELLPTDPGYPRGVQVVGTAPPVYVSLPRPAVTRGEARLQLSTPLLLARAVSVEPFVRGSLLGYAFDADRPAAATAWGVAGLSSSAQLARRFGSVEHRIIPRLELLAGTAPWRARPGDPFPAYDLWDRIESERTVPIAVPGPRLVPAAVVQKLSAAPDGAYTQLRANLESRLDAGAGGRLVVGAGQDLDVRAGRLAETSGWLQASRGPFSADVNARVLAFGGRPPLTAGWKASWLDQFTHVHAGAAVHDARGDNLRAALDSAGSGAVGADNAGVDALFDLRPSGAAPDAWYTLGARGVLGGAALDYSVKLAARDVPAVQCSNHETKSLHAGQPVEQTAILTWDSPCHCFVARVRTSLDACGKPSLGIDVDLSKMLQGAGPVR